jgi:sulfur relay (sulfurtransferase) complex TusBCD TusD component (DsrE family)
MPSLLCLVLDRGPYGSIEAAKAIRHAGGALGKGWEVVLGFVGDGVYTVLAGQGHALTLCCLQDAALLASTCAPGPARTALARLLNRGARCLVLQDDLVLRGLGAASSVSPVDHAGVVAALVAGHDRVIGAL